MPSMMENKASRSRRMSMRSALMYVVVAGALVGQDPGSPIDVQGLRQALSQDLKPAGLPVDVAPRTSLLVKPDAVADEAKKADLEKLEKALAEAKRKENAPRRFAADLFETRQTSLSATTDGGVSDEYVLGTGDILQLNVFGSATFDVPLSVDGKGEVVVPKIGTVKVAGMTLAKARQALQGKVSEQFSRTSAALSVIKLREVRIFILGEVYKPGSVLVPSLSSMVNVLSLAGGPTLLGSFRDIRLLRGGKVVHAVDLYPLRADGKGNLNVYLQNGDTIFVPLAQTQVMLEGAFTRVMPPERLFQGGLWARNDQVEKEAQRQDPQVQAKVRESRMGPNERPEDVLDESFKDGKGKGPAVLKPSRQEGMLFELLPQETAADVLRFAGGFVASAHAERLSLRRVDANGVTSILDLAAQELVRTRLQRGDVLTSQQRREQLGAAVTLAGWARVPGQFARTPGLKVGALLKRDHQLLPDTYLQRAEIVRTLSDGSTRHLAFHVEKAIQGDAAHDLVLEDRDRIELYSLERMRLPRKVILNGPFTKAGEYEFHAGMRLADLIFKAGIPEKRANTFVVELARSQYGKPSVVRSLDLSKLISTESLSPLEGLDEAMNPTLQQDDVVTVYEKPEFRLHRTVRITGQVARPGAYVLEKDRPMLSELIQRAGGLMPEAMPSAGIFLRNLSDSVNEGVKDPDTQLAGVADILERLNETKMVELKVDPSKTGGAPMVFKPPILHGLGTTRVNRMVVDFGGILAQKGGADVELQHGDEIIIPRKTDAAMILGETSTPFAFYHLNGKTSVGDLLKLAGGVTRNADKSNIRLLKADGRIQDSWVSWRTVEPGDAVLVPQRIRYESRWQENVQALTPLALLLNAIR